MLHVGLLNSYHECNEKNNVGVCIFPRSVSEHIVLLTTIPNALHSPFEFRITHAIGMIVRKKNVIFF